MKKNINEIFSYLIGRLNHSDEVKKTTDSIISELLRGTPANKSKFEFSFKIEKGKIGSSLRFVNYDNYSSNFENLYIKKIDLVQNIINSHIKNRKVDILFKKIRDLKEFRLPIYFGAEVKRKRPRFKIYIHLFEKPLIGNSQSLRAIVNYLFKGLEITTALKENDICLVGLDFDHKSNLIHKIYYFYDWQWKNYAKAYKFSPYEQKAFYLLKPFGVNPHIREKYQKNKFISQKLDIQLKNGLREEILAELLKLSKNTACFNEISNIIKGSRAKIYAIGTEKDTLTIYIRSKANEF